MKFLSPVLKSSPGRLFTAIAAIILTVFTSCNNSPKVADAQTAVTDTSFSVEAESFADLQILRYRVPGFDELSIQQKQLSYYLYEAAMCGRDIIYDQKSKYGIMLRKTLEAGYASYKGEKTSNDWAAFETYCGRFWFSNGNHHHYGNEKFIPARSLSMFCC